jgi:hypothetical protein
VEKYSPPESALWPGSSTFRVRERGVSSECLVLTACSGQIFRNYGRIEPNGKVTDGFERYEINPEFHYYISGSDLFPNALMGLHKGYHLDPETLQ